MTDVWSEHQNGDEEGFSDHVSVHEPPSLMHRTQLGSKFAANHKCNLGLSTVLDGWLVKLMKETVHTQNLQHPFSLVCAVSG